MDRIAEYEHHKRIIALTSKSAAEYDQRIKALIERLGI